MQSIELTVKNLDEAKTTAAELLGVTPDVVTITVLEESKKLFGKVSYKVRAEAPAAPVATAPEAEEAPKAAKKPARKKAEAKETEVKEEVTEAPVEEAAPAAESAPADSSRKRLGKKKAESDAPVATETAAAVAPATATDSETEDAGPEIIATEEDAAKLAGILDQLTQLSGLDAEIKVGELQGKYINLSIDGKEASYFVGKSGEVLNSLQYLINLIVKQQLANGVRVTLDGNDFRKRRADSLTSLALKIADKVVERGEEAVLEALPAFERRVIHKILQDHPQVQTYSEGEEPDRRVVIAPRD